MTKMNTETSDRRDDQLFNLLDKVMWERQFLCYNHFSNEEQMLRYRRLVKLTSLLETRLDLV